MSLTMRFEKEYITWERAPTAAQGQGPNNKNFTAYLSVQVPQAEVWYVPQWSEMLKFAWIQYYRCTRSCPRTSWPTARLERARSHTPSNGFRGLGSERRSTDLHVQWHRRQAPTMASCHACGHRASRRKGAADCCWGAWGLNQGPAPSTRVPSIYPSKKRTGFKK